MAIIAKNLSTGGSDYDGRKAAEARKLVDAALRNYPELANDDKKHEFLVRQLARHHLQQAEKDFKMAEFCERTGHPGSAYFQYEHGQPPLSRARSTPTGRRADARMRGRWRRRTAPS